MCREEKLKIVLSSGLIVFALLQAFAIVAGNRIAPRIERSLGIVPIEAPQSVPISVNWDTATQTPGIPVDRSLPANPAARAEIKHTPQGVNLELKEQAQGCPCTPRPVPHYYPNPSNYTPVRTPSVTIQPTNVTPVATTPRKSILLFVGNDSASQALLSWFNLDPQLQQLRTKVNFHTYTRDSPLYRSRYQSAVPVEYFPAVLFVDENGGHIHAAYGNNLPQNPATLYGDLATAFRLQQQVVTQRQQAPTLSIPRAVTPIEVELQNAAAPELMIRAEGPCPDGHCPADRDGRVFPIFDRNKDSNPMEFFRAFRNPTESLVVVLLVAVVAYVAVQRMRGN